MKSILLTLLLTAITAVGFAQSPITNADDPISRDAENVISIYGDTYTTIDEVNYDPNWGQSGHTLVNPAFDPGTGNSILAYPNFNYQGTEFPAQSASGMEFLHVDIWVPQGTNRMIKVSPIDNSGSGPSEILVEVSTTPGSWNSVDIPIGDFTDMTWQSVFQLKFDGQFNSDGSANTEPFDVYLDNIFFWKNASTEDNIATLNDLKIDGVTIDGFDSGVLNYTFGLEEGTTDVPQITDATPTNPNAAVTITQANGIPGNATVEVVSESGNAERTYTVSFAITMPSQGAPDQPARNPEDVISIFSDAYDDITVDTFSADFDDSTIEDIIIDGNPAKRINFTNFIAIDFQSNKQDASEMTHFHMDFWTVETDLVGKVFNSKFSHWGGTDGEVSALELNINTGTNPAIESGTWVTIDVPISDFVGDLTRDDIAQFLITSNLDVVIVDNIYLYKGMGVSNEVNESANTFELNQNYPNPFNPSTSISYVIPESADVKLEVFNSLGQRVATLVNGVQNAGSHTVSFDASNLASGIYLYKLTSGNQVKTNKMLLIK